MSNPMSEARQDSRPAITTADDAGHRRRILVTVCVALMAVVAAVTGLNVAQPPLAIDLNASQAQVLWMINIYAITLAALLLPLGAVGDRWGRKTLLLGGLFIFGIANIASGLAPSVEIMLGARFLSGVGAAMIMPVTLSVITAVFPDEERSNAIGVWTGVAGGGGILGMFLSAALVDYLTWRWLFALPVALAAVSFWMTLRSVPNSRVHSDHGFDLGGALISAAAIISLIWFLHEGPTRGWTIPATLARARYRHRVGCRLYGLGAETPRPSARHPALPPARTNQRLRRPAHMVRGSGRCLHRALPVLPGGAGLVRIEGDAGPDADGGAHDGIFRRGPTRSKSASAPAPHLPPAC